MCYIARWMVKYPRGSCAALLRWLCHLHVHLWEFLGLVQNAGQAWLTITCVLNLICLILEFISFFKTLNRGTLFRGTPTFSLCLQHQKDSPGSVYFAVKKWQLLPPHWFPVHHKVLLLNIWAFVVSKLKKQSMSKDTLQENRNQLFDEVHEKPWLHYSITKPYHSIFNFTSTFVPPVLNLPPRFMPK